ncbi:Uncharacterized membrane protein, required for colicin V production [Anaerobranca californiensis DSM 14826]|jgi:uncharacterized membrane protein required for colicin V production|uniref:Uncharacterized membrane protein, required for colicin V production n=1 Tax=Anaerobranca californiensis DSM 14826 TaxID=1120989 RepID=A0A1M6PTH5_9FIRM|nr:CvpA family protein [Anaerobranca californiensis]SHK11190.1 Uncharacterized membrane protein, required for colicin V production [Anaerobranca californiensis DSM 14826]
MLDLLIIIFIFFAIVNGRKKGLVRGLLELGSILLAFIVASRFGSNVGNLLDSIFELTPKIKDSINIPFIDITDEITKFIGVIGYIVIFFIARFVLGIVIVQTSLINQIPLIGTANKLLGAVLGFIKGYLLCLMAVWLLSFIAVDWAENLLDKSYLAPILLDSFPSIYWRLNFWLSN